MKSDKLAGRNRKEAWGCGLNHPREKEKQSMQWVPHDDQIGKIKQFWVPWDGQDLYDETPFSL